MSETRLEVAGQNVITVRLDPTNVCGRSIMGTPALLLPLELQLLPRQGGEPDYAAVRIEGSLTTAQRIEIARFDPGPLDLGPSPHPHFRQQQATAHMDRTRAKRLEDLRNGNDANLIVSLSCLVWLPAQRRFQVARASEFQVTVPKSHWVERVVAEWGLSETKVIEINFPKNATGENFRAAYSKVEAAERDYANGQWKQTLAELYSAFESLARASDFARPDQQFFAALLSDLHPAKKEKLKLALDSLCAVLHLGRHEPKQATETFAVSHGDARLALIMAHAIFEYITPEADGSQP